MMMLIFIYLTGVLCSACIVQHRDKAGNIDLMKSFYFWLLSYVGIFYLIIKDLKS